MKMNTDVRRPAALALLLIGLAIVLMGCEAVEQNGGQSVSGKGTAADADQPEQGEVRIVIENFVFAPAEITVAPGTKVTWINKDEAPHTATSADQKFNSGGLDTGDRFSFIFNDRGEYQYICTLHPHMKAVIRVE